MLNIRILALVLTIFSSLFLKISCDKCYAPAVYREINFKNAKCNLDENIKVSHYNMVDFNEDKLNELQSLCLHEYDSMDKTEISHDDCKVDVTSDCKRRNRFDGTYSYVGHSLYDNEKEYLNSAKFTGSVIEKDGKLIYSENPDLVPKTGFIAATNAPIGDFREIVKESVLAEKCKEFDYFKGCYSGNFLLENPESPNKESFDKENTMLAFYKGLKKHKIDYIVMLTNFYEQNTNKNDGDCGCKVKADRYFADQIGVLDLKKPDYSPSTASVKTDSLTTNEYGTTTETRKLIFTDDDAKTTHEVTHYHYKAWIDFAVPEGENRQQLFKLIEYLRNEKDKGKNIIVHCTGGIGRTGTFISSVLTSKLQADKNFKLIEFILELRKKRPGLVETPGQLGLLIENMRKTTVASKRKMKKRKK